MFTRIVRQQNTQGPPIEGDRLPPTAFEPHYYFPVGDEEGYQEGYVPELAQNVQAWLERQGWPETVYRQDEDIAADAQADLISLLATPQPRTANSLAHAEAATNPVLRLRWERVSSGLTARMRKIAAGVLPLA